MNRRIKLFGVLGAAALSAAACLAIAAPASAATLTQVTGFGTNPTNLGMHLYVPDNVAARPAILVAVHFCTGSGPAFYSGTQFAALADQYKFIVIYPSATRSGQCFDVYSADALRHDGASDPVGIVSMVRYVQQRYNGDPDRVFVTGASSGGMMTNVLLGDYPDVFKAGAAFMGVPFGCFATTGGSTWNSDCANGLITKTPQQWGDLVRAAYPGYSGARPRMQVWHGTADDTLRYPNFNETIKQWTNVHGLSQTPSYTDQPQSNWTRTRYGGTGTGVAVEAISLNGVGHSIPTNGMAAYVIDFFGLSGTLPTTTPPVTPPPVTTPPVTTPPAPAGGCRVTYAVNAWNTGLTATITVTNSGTAPINGWTLGFTLPSGQTISSGWNASYSPVSGAVTARNVSHNATIGVNGSVGIGFQAAHTGDTAEPTSFTVNGSSCAVA